MWLLPADPAATGACRKMKMCCLGREKIDAVHTITHNACEFSHVVPLVVHSVWISCWWRFPTAISCSGSTTSAQSCALRFLVAHAETCILWSFAAACGPVVGGGRAQRAGLPAALQRGRPARTAGDVHGAAGEEAGGDAGPGAQAPGRDAAAVRGSVAKVRRSMCYIYIQLTCISFQNW